MRTTVKIITLSNGVKLMHLKSAFGTHVSFVEPSKKIEKQW